MTPTTGRKTFVIIGAGLAGASAAIELRRRTSADAIVLLGDEKHVPYERPGLSKGYLRGTLARTELDVREATFYAEHDIDLRLSTPVRAIEPRRHIVVTDGGMQLRYDRLLLATGAEPRPLSLPGSELSGIQYLRTIEDAEAITAAARRGHPVVVVGAGWIGTEVAASLRQLGSAVTVVAPDGAPLAKVLGPQIGSFFLALHREHGVDMRMGRRVLGFGGQHNVEQVLLDDGTSIDAGLVVVGAGARPRVRLALAAGLHVADGIMVDERLRTSDVAIFAAGDVASTWHAASRRRRRVEHWDNARAQGRTVAASMLGLDEPYTRVPYFFSDQYDVHLEYVGYAPAWDRIVFRGDRESRAFLAFWLTQGVVTACATIGMSAALGAMRALVGARVDEKQLSDATIPLEHLPATAHGRATRGPAAGTPAS